MDFHSEILDRVKKLIISPTTNVRGLLNEILRLLAKWRCHLILNDVINRHNLRVLDGPFKGLEFVAKSTEGCHIPKLLGSYEQPLSPYIEEIISKNYSNIINIGCAEGYYAVGLASRMKTAQILACDINIEAQKTCLELSKKNNVADQISVAGEFLSEDFENIKGEKIIVLCDIEGNEKYLLDPNKAPSLIHMDILVETHGVDEMELLIQRFESTHDITIVEDDGHRTLDSMPSWFKGLAHLDQLLAVWEWRLSATPWLIMHSKNT